MILCPRCGYQMALHQRVIDSKRTELYYKCLVCLYPDKEGSYPEKEGNDEPTT